ncbi:MAG: MmgE/PrpD family protein [Porphyrobacter sp.]|nr:MmgE/PrpD family protein [Porphyrobacter sp.]
MNAPAATTDNGPEARLIAHALGVRWEDLPQSARDAAKALLLDTLAVGVAGRSEARAEAVMRLAQSWSGPAGECLLLGRPETRLRAPYAAFVNAYQIHCQEFDCVHEPAVVHPMATICAAVLAESGRKPPVSGQQMLEAIVAGIEVATALGIAARGSLRFFRPATAGIFGCVAAIARLRALSPETARCAMGHALAFTSGTMQAHGEGKPNLALQVAAAARSAVEAADLAAAGFPAPDHALSGPFGFLSLLESDTQIEPVLEQLGHKWQVEQVSWKPFPTGRAAHGGIVAIQTLMRDDGLTAEALESLVYRAPPIIARLVGRAASAEMPISHARLCLPWLGAVTLARGSVGLGDFGDADRADPALLALAARISVETDGSDDWSAFAPGEAVAITRDGKRLTARIEQQFGSPDCPPSPEQFLAKVTAALRYGGWAKAAMPLLDLIDCFESEGDAHQSLCGVFA